MLTRSKVADRLGKSIATVRRMEGIELHPTRDERGVHWFDEDEVAAVAGGSGQRVHRMRQLAEYLEKAASATKGREVERSRLRSSMLSQRARFGLYCREEAKTEREWAQSLAELAPSEVVRRSLGIDACQLEQLIDAVSVLFAG